MCCGENKWQEELLSSLKLRSLLKSCLVRNIEELKDRIIFCRDLRNFLFIFFSGKFHLKIIEAS